MFSKYPEIPVEKLTPFGKRDHRGLLLRLSASIKLGILTVKEPRFLHVCFHVDCDYSNYRMCPTSNVLNIAPNRGACHSLPVVEHKMSHITALP